MMNMNTCNRVACLAVIAIVIPWSSGCRAKHPTMAVRQGNGQASEPARSASPDPQEHPNQFTAYRLVTAAKSGDVATLETVLGEGADVNTLAWGAWSPLHAAASAGELEAVKFLVARGANVNLKSGNERTPLWEAAQNDHDKVTAYLREQGGAK